MQPVVHSIKRSSGRMGQPVVTPTPRHPLCTQALTAACAKLSEGFAGLATLHLACASRQLSNSSSNQRWCTYPPLDNQLYALHCTVPSPGTLQCPVVMLPTMPPTVSPHLGTGLKAWPHRWPQQMQSALMSPWTLSTPWGQHTAPATQVRLRMCNAMMAWRYVKETSELVGTYVPFVCQGWGV
jgi:hypothetical protein